MIKFRSKLNLDLGQNLAFTSFSDICMTCSLLEICAFYTFQPIFLLNIFFLSSTSLLLFHPVVGTVSPSAVNSSHLQPHKIYSIHSSWQRQEILTGFMPCRKCCQGALICILSISSFLKLMQRKVWDETNGFRNWANILLQVILNCTIFHVSYFEHNKDVSNMFFTTLMKMLYKLLIL